MKNFIIKLKNILCEYFLFEVPRGVFYINGKDELPPPLETEKEQEMLSLLSNEKESLRARNVLIEHNLRLVVYIAKKFENTNVGTEDLISIGTIGLIKAISSFKPEKNIKLATYASKCIENEILMYIRKTSNVRSEISIDEPLNVDWDGNELLLCDVLGTDKDDVNKGIEEEEEKISILKAVSRLSSRDREIIVLRFGLDGKEEMTQKEVADLLGISQSYISRLEKKIILKLKKEVLKN